MATKGYSVRFTRNYYRNPKTGKWCGHSIAAWDENGRSRKWATVEAAKEYAEARIEANRATHDADAEGFILWAKIYNGKDCVETIK